MLFRLIQLAQRKQQKRENLIHPDNHEMVLKEIDRLNQQLLEAYKTYDSMANSMQAQVDQLKKDLNRIENKMFERWKEREELRTDNERLREELKKLDYMRQG